MSHPLDDPGAMPTPDETIHELARHGVVTWRRLLDAGLTPAQIRARLERGSLRRARPGVYATFGTPLGFEARVLAAVEATGPRSVASHRSALVLWDLLDGDHPIDVTAPRSSHPTPAGVVLHRPLVLRPRDVTIRRHIPVTNPLRSLLDAGAVLPRSSVGDCVERALNQRLVTVRGLRVILGELGRPGRSGTGPLRQYLDRRALGDKRPESLMEPVMARLLYADLGIGTVEYQPTLVLDGTKVRPDFRIMPAMVLLEYDGLDAHSGREALERDLTRQNLLMRHGYAVLRYTASHLRRPAAVVREVVTVCRQRMAELGRPGAA